MYEFIHSTYFQDLISSFSSGVAILNRDFIIYAINEAATKIFQKSRKDILTNHCEAFFVNLDHYDDFKRIIDEVAQLHTKGHSLATTITRQDKSVLNLELSVSPLIYYEKLYGIFVEMKDVTHIYKLHAKEKKILNEKRAVEKLRTESLKLFALAVAHQIRNPVTVIGGLSNRLIRCNLEPEKTKKFLNTIYESGKRLEMITRAVNDFMVIKKEGPGKTTLLEVLKQTRAYLKTKFPEIYPKVIWYEEGIECPFFCYPQLVSLAIRELVKNSFEAMGQNGGAVDIRCCLENSDFMISITDTGCGIDDLNKPFLFDPFFTTHEKSVGMGLCKVEKIMKEHKGYISIKSLDSGGTEVRLIFPQGMDAYTTPSKY